MNRRGLLKLGFGVAVALGVVGGGLVLLRPGLIDRKLSPHARVLMRAVGLVVLDGLWPAPGPLLEAALAAHLDILDKTISGFPLPVRNELSEVFALLTNRAGRWSIAGLYPDWDRASNTDVHEALKSMRDSGLAIRQQIYHALRDLHNAAFFSDPAHWPLIGYPGPKVLL
jgi:hypothetical protein